ncbi:hypothetical protein AX17_000326 [Amanita inopinata Kibby_2008]|nr:hypothetical protein AX17_000326 [Amanita inopinata Kibby_2008]
MSPETRLRSRIQQMKEDAQAIQKLCPRLSSEPKRPIESLHPLPTSMKLPAPQEIVVDLQNAGLPLHLAQETSNAYVHAMNQIRHQVEQMMQRMLAIFSDKFADSSARDQKIYKIGLRAYAQHLKMDKDRALALVGKKLGNTRQYSSSDSRHNTRKSPAFNHSSTPLLETYFDHNAYPSAPDRAILAKKTRMTERQIEVWFQNHRNRAKKEGKHLRRRKSEPHPVPLLQINNAIDFNLEEFHRPPTIIETDSSSDDDELILGNPLCQSPSQAPAHAFPARYPPNCNYKPFPIEPDQRNLPPPDWTRKPIHLAAGSSRHVDLTEIDELSQMFSKKLLLTDGVKTSRRIKRLVPAVLSSTHIIPSPAPLPALLTAAPTPRTRMVLPYGNISSATAFPTAMSSGQNSRCSRLNVAISQQNSPRLTKHGHLTPGTKMSNPNSRLTSPVDDDYHKSPQSSQTERRASFSSNASSSLPTTPLSLHTQLPDDTSIFITDTTSFTFLASEELEGAAADPYCYQHPTYDLTLSSNVDNPDVCFRKPYAQE